MILVSYFFNDTATTEIYTLSLHDALPISGPGTTSGTTSPPTRCPTTRCTTSSCRASAARRARAPSPSARTSAPAAGGRSEEHTSELQSRLHLVCRLLLEKKKT